MDQAATPQRRRPRADALRNREALLTAADAVFGESGTDAPLEHVARRAAVGIGTLYGHFPTRRALIAGLLDQHNETLFEHGKQLLMSSTPGAGLAEWVRAVVRHAAAYRGLAAVLAASQGDDNSELHSACVRMNHIGAQLVARAHDSGDLDSAITSEDIVTVINAASWTREHAGSERGDRLIALALNGFGVGR